MMAPNDCTKTSATSCWQAGKVESALLFRCAACAKPSSTTGRKLQRVLGLRQYVCARCASGPRL